MNGKSFSKWVGVSLSGFLISCMLAVFIVVPAASPVLANGITVTRTLPATVVPGQLFQVTIGFTAQYDEFHGGVDDSAPNTPGDWLVSAQKSWSNPEPSNLNLSGNDFGAVWTEEFNDGTEFTVVYKVQVPDNATPGTYNFTNGLLSYYDSSTTDPQSAMIADDSVEVLKPGEVWVDDAWAVNSTGDYVWVNGDRHVFGYDAFDTIQGGVDGVGDSTVHVLAGTYDAFNVTGRDNLDILGQGYPEVTSSSLNGGNTSWTMAWVYNSTDIIIDGFVFEGDCASATFGIYYQNSTGAINDVYIYDVVGDSPPTGKGIVVDQASLPNTVNISDSTIEDCEIGVYVEDDTVNLTDCIIDGRTVTYSDQSVGIYAAANATVTAEGCEISGCNVTVPPDSPLVGPPTESDYGHGVYVSGTATVELGCCCKIHDNDIGIYVDYPGDLTANGNSIYSNTYWGLYFEGSPFTPPSKVAATYVDAEENWWGDSSGPGGVGEGTGDNVTSGVDFIPWLDGPCPGGKPVGPNAEFSGTPTRGLSTLCVDFTDESVPYDAWDIDTWAWDFDGDGTVDSTEQNPTHCYPVAGMYTVSLAITDEHAQSDIETKVRYIMVLSPEGVELTTELPGPAKFSASYLLISPQQVFPNQEVEVSINIANHGEERGSHSVALYINGVVEGSETIGVSPGGTQLVVFQVRRAIPGQYLVSVEGQEGQFTVISEKAPPSASTATPAPASGGGLGTAGIIVIWWW